MRLRQYLGEPNPNYHEIQHDVERHQHDRYADRLRKADQKDRAEQPDQHQGEQNGAIEPVGGERVFHNVGRRIGSRQRNRNDKAGCRKAYQAEHKQLPFPPRHQALKHRD